MTVSMAKDGHEAAKRRAREEEAEAKRKANALPVWIARSTITGDPMTAAPPNDAPEPSAARIPSSPTRPDVKPTKAEADLDADLDAYFAAQQGDGQPSALGPLGLTRSTSTTSSSNGSASLTGSSSVIKRSRDQDEGYASLENLHEPGSLDPDESDVRYGKKPRRSSGSSPVTTLVEAVVVDDDDEDEDEVEAVERAEGEDERQVMCGGKLVMLRDVTDEMAETLMVSRLVLCEWGIHADVSFRADGGRVHPIRRPHVIHARRIKTPFRNAASRQLSKQLTDTAAPSPTPPATLSDGAGWASDRSDGLGTASGLLRSPTSYPFHASQAGPARTRRPRALRYDSPEPSEASESERAAEKHVRRRGSRPRGEMVGAGVGEEEGIARAQEGPPSKTPAKRSEASPVPR